ncbi:hypothetical protein L484_024284 [Morus notabilis]|uniref:Uncharacterized protein n=1 Tax=Morus notabilis TaxID=981085 RepID=W9QPM8_9ROSA|nr:hypothetical protein L484_024284 [Morus notabilis]
MILRQNAKGALVLLSQGSELRIEMLLPLSRTQETPLAKLVNPSRQQVSLTQLLLREPAILGDSTTQPCTHNCSSVIPATNKARKSN